MNQKDLQQILDDHKKWINDDGGKRADLSYSDLRDSDLRGAGLRGADLRGADLRGADLRGSDLRGSRGISPEQCQPLLLLQYQVGKIRAFKVVTGNFESPCAEIKLVYTIGSMVEVADVNDNPDYDCGAGINLATLDWCLKTYRGELQEGKFRLLLCEFTAADIVAIPHASDGKFRVRRCKVIKEIDASEWVKTEA